MTELHTWLSVQHPGLRTYKTFQQKTMQLARLTWNIGRCTNSCHRSSIPYIDSFDGEPLPADVAEISFGRLRAVVRDAENSIALAPLDQVKVLNEIAAVELMSRFCA